MADPFGIAAGVIAVLQITNSVLSVCYNYSAAAKDAPWELSRVVAEMESLRNVLQTLEPLAHQAESADATAETRLPTLTLLCGSKGALQHCRDEVTRLEKRLKTPSWSDGFGPKRKAFIQALRWPLNKAETKEALVNIGRFKDTFNLAITADEVALTLAIQDLSSSTNHIVLGTHKDVCSIKDTITGLFRDIQSTKDETLVLHRGMEKIERERIYRWLDAPDPSTNHNRASRSRQADTGSWLLDSETFTHWIEVNSLVWLHGKPGCGKTVLSSTVINEVLQESRSKSDVAVAYFYFDFNDVEKQKPDRMIRSLITQLSRQSTKKLDELESLFSTCNNGGRQPEDERLMIVLKEAVESFDKTYIILDALDECSDTKELMESIEEVQGWQLPQLHMLITSRKLKDIEDSLEPLISSGGNICIQSTLVDADIRAYVGERLHNDRGLKRWRNMPQVQKEIETTLMKKADGMFRWAVCQLDAIQDCLRLPALREALTSLPRTLDETYSRILCSFPEERSQDAIRILQWLTYSVRPVRVDELAEIVAVNTTGSPWFNCEDRFPEQEEVLTICSSLVTVEEGSMSEEDDLVSKEDDLVSEEDDLVSEEDDLASEEEDGPVNYRPIPVVRLAHFSVKEYLVSERIRNQATATARYAMQEIQANQSIAAVCLAYLLQFDQLESMTSRTEKDFPLARYAAAFWMKHTLAVGKDLDPIKMLILEFCKVHGEAYINWYRLCNPERPWMGFDLKRNLAEIASPLHYGSLGGMTELVRFLLEKGADVNAEGGEYGNALQAASVHGHETVVQLLLDKGADVNAKGGDYDSALHAATLCGHKAVMRLLLDNGAHREDIMAMHCRQLL